MNKFSSILGAGAILFAGSASASVVTDLYGDKDCFGTGGACVEDGTTWLPGGWSAVTASPADPTWTDRQFSGGTASWSHSLAAGVYTSASIAIRTLGMADIAGPYDVLIDGVVVGSMPRDGFGHILVETFNFTFDAALLSDGMANVSVAATSGDAWAIDYSEITASTDGGSAVPVPAPVMLLGIGLLGLRAARRLS